MDFMKPATVREGVKWLPDKQLDVFFVTLNKADKDYSPTTMYNDYSISESLFHWQSQSTTAENSPTGKSWMRPGAGPPASVKTRAAMEEVYAVLMTSE